MFWLLIHFVLINSDSISQFTQDEVSNHALIFQFLNSSTPLQQRRNLDDVSTQAPTEEKRWDQLYSGLDCRTGGPDFRSECIEVTQKQINTRLNAEEPTEPPHLGVCQDDFK